jgi:hypothetical protein
LATCRLPRPGQSPTVAWGGHQQSPGQGRRPPRPSTSRGDVATGPGDTVRPPAATGAGDAAVAAGTGGATAGADKNVLVNEKKGWRC